MDEYQKKEVQSKFKRLKIINEEIDILEKNKPPVKNTGAMQYWNANMSNLKTTRTELLNRINKLTKNT